MQETGFGQGGSARSGVNRGGHSRQAVYMEASNVNSHVSVSVPPHVVANISLIDPNDSCSTCNKTTSQESVGCDMCDRRGKVQSSFGAFRSSQLIFFSQLLTGFLTFSLAPK